MLKIVFKNLEPSQLAREIVQERIAPVIEKFPSLVGHSVTLTLEMKNSPNQSGPDFFTVTTMVTGKTFKKLKISKSSQNFYHATAELVDGFNELLSCESDRLIKKSRKQHISAGDYNE